MSQSIMLGGRTFDIAPLTLGQMRTAGPAFTRIGIDTPEGMAAQITVIAAAIRAADASLTPAASVELIDGLVGVTFAELKAAVETIGEMMGLGRKETAPGEARPAEAPATASPS